MNANTFSNWTQALSAIAIVIGLILVVMELRQNSALVRAQLLSDGYSDHFAYYRQMMGEDPSPTLIKACFNPEELSESELTVAAAAMDYRYAAVEKSKLLEAIAGFGSDWKKGAEIQMRRMLETPLGRLDFEQNKDLGWYFDPEIVEIGERVLASPDFEDCTARYIAWKEGLRAGTPSTQ